MPETGFDERGVIAWIVAPHRCSNGWTDGFRRHHPRECGHRRHQFVERRVSFVSDYGHGVVAVVDFDGERNAEHPRSWLRVGSDTHAHRLRTFPVAHPPDSGDGKAIGTIEFGEGIGGFHGDADAEIRHGVAQRIVDPKSTIVRPDEFAKNNGGVDPSLNHLPNELLCHTLNLMVDTRILRWSEGVLRDEPTTPGKAGNVHVADSWLTVDGAAVAVDRHFERFASSVHTRQSQVDVVAFTDAVRFAVPDAGRWFPRIEAIDIAGELTLRLHVRAAPEPSAEVTLATAAHDPRSDPSVKGPDLVALGQLRTELGVGEAIIVDDGFVAEGAWSSVVWWLNDRLHCVDPSIARLSGVTESVLRDFARHVGSPVVPSRVRPPELDGAEVWVLSSLHGIRVATEWRNGPSLHVEPGRAEYWRTGYVNNREVICRT